MWKEVSKDEFISFIKNYPAPLETNVVHICEPPQLEFYDFSLDEKPSIKSKVAYLYDDYLENDKRHYFLKAGDGK